MQTAAGAAHGALGRRLGGPLLVNLRSNIAQPWRLPGGPGSGAGRRAAARGGQGGPRRGLRHGRLRALRRRRRLCARRGQLRQGVLAGVRPQVRVLHLELVDPLHQFRDALLQDFHLLAHREHQVALNQILKQTNRYITITMLQVKCLCESIQWESRKSHKISCKCREIFKTK